MATNITTFLTAKILTYYFNALIDAQTTDEICKYIRSDRKKNIAKSNEAQIRGARLVASHAHPSDSFLVGLAYTLYYVNGLADYIYVRILSLLLPKKEWQLIENYTQKLSSTLETDHLYQQYEGGNLFLLTYWLQIVMDSFHWLPEFIKERWLGLKTIERAELIKAAHEVQKQNRKYNEQVAQILLSGEKSDLPKVKLLREAAVQSANPQAFLQACANTQRAAARWDWIYTKLVN